MGGLVLVVLIPQNLVYLGVRVRISAWLILGAALVQVWLCRHKFAAWAGTLYSSAEIRTMAAVIFLTITFHGIVPIQQGLEWYYGKGHFDQINYVLLAEFLKENPYGTSAQEIGSASLVSRPRRVSSHRRTARNEFWARSRDDRTQEGETRPEYHHGRNERLVGNGRERRLRRDRYLFLNAAGSLRLRCTARDRDRSLHGRVRRGAGSVSACCHSTLTGRISVTGIRAFCFPVFRNSAPARGS